MIPLHTHGCEECYLLATQDGVDFYACRKGLFPTVVARFSSEPSDYTSAPIFGEVTDEALDAAARYLFEGRLRV